MRQADGLPVRATHRASPRSKVGEAAGFGKGRGCDGGVPMAAALLRPGTGALRKRPVKVGQGQVGRVMVG